MGRARRAMARSIEGTQTVTGFMCWFPFANEVSKRGSFQILFSNDGRAGIFGSAGWERENEAKRSESIFNPSRGWKIPSELRFCEF